MYKFIFLKKFREAFDLKRDTEFFHRVKDSIESGIYFRGVNLYILIFAILICSLGLDVNSTAVIIGAMLISPLMGPIIGMGFGLGTTNWDLIIKSSRNYAIATVIALISSAIYFWLSPLNLEQSEMLSRTQPTIYDVLIAFIGGFAGIMATSTKLKGNVIPGVAIATALMPPLCTAGFGLAELNFPFFFGALYLYLINTVFIGMATFLACRILRFPVRQTEPKNIAKAQKIGLAVALLTFVPAVYLGVILYSKTRFETNAQNYIQASCQLPDNYLFSNQIDYDKKTIQLVYGGSAIPDSVKQALKNELANYKLEDANLVVVESFSKPMEDIQKNISGVYSQLDQKTILLQRLNSQFDSFQRIMTLQNAELRVLQNFEEIKDIQIMDNKTEFLAILTPRSKKKRRELKFIEIGAEDSSSIHSLLTHYLNSNKLKLKILKD